MMISIGLPEKGKMLIDYLVLEQKELYDKLLYVDPDNRLYDILDLNRGIQRTFFNVNTPFAFLRRLTTTDGMNDLFAILSRWKDVAFTPPKQAQALLQGGTFVFYGNKTLFAHYDPSTAAHASIHRVLEIATEASKKEGKSNI